MKDKINTSKLDTHLAHDKIVKTCTQEKEVASVVTAAPEVKFKLKFTDYAIKNFMSSFGIPPKARVITPFDVSKHSALKGLKLVQYFKSKKKYFFLRYWYNGRSLPLTIGQFIPGKSKGEPPIFGVKQCQDKLHDL